MPTALMSRMTSKFVVREDGCWEWVAAKSSAGYGIVRIARRNVPAHRVMYELLVGEIPHGLEMDHLCRVRACVNPSHLEPVTRQVNMLRGQTVAAANAARTHCAQGHPFDETNTYRWEIKPGRYIRKCRTCQSIKIRRWRERRGGK